MSGLVTRIKRLGGRFSQYRYDKLGRVIRADYHEKSYESFVYNRNGALVEMENQYTKLRFERDKADRIVREWLDNRWIASIYDELGNRTQVTSSFGANILTKYNEQGQASHLVAYLDKAKPWVAKMEYDVAGQEVQRLLPGGISSSWEYDPMGRPICHELRHGIGYSETLRKRKYEWDMNYRLKKVTNELTKGVTTFSYDQFSNLISARENGLEAIFRSTDSVGNLYTTQDNSDCIYGAGSRLERSGIDLKEKRNTFQGGYGKLVTKGVEFFYDEEGNLAKKIEPDGAIWSYFYFGTGMLRKVIRPDGSGVSFKYDPLGRRIEKTVTKSGSERAALRKEDTQVIAEKAWQVVGGVRIRKPAIEQKQLHIVQGNNQSVYEEEGCSRKSSQKEKIEKVVRYLWDGNTLLHEWEEEKKNCLNLQPKVDYKADFVLKQEKKEAQETVQRAERGQAPPDSLITWVFQDDFIPRGKITKDGNYSIISDYLGTPVEAYDENGKKVWERELDIYGRVKPARKDIYGKTEKEIGEKTFIPFRFQGQYEDEESGLYYNRYRYYDPELGQYTQQDPIGLSGGNPTLYGYVFDTLSEIDPYGLTWKDLLDSGLGHHLFPRSVAKKLGINELAKLTALSWYPNVTVDSGELHQDLHRLFRENGIPFHGSKFTGNLDEFWKKALKAYDGVEAKGYLKIPGTDTKLFEDLTPQEGIKKIKELYEKGELPTKCRG